jgi:hypothetical protein
MRVVVGTAFGALLLVAGSISARGEDWPPQPKPTAHYASLEAARDSIGAIISRCVSLADTAIHVSRERVTFEYLYAKGTAKGWAYHIIVNDTTACPNDAVGKELTDAGWVESFGYSADGADGSDMGYVSRNFFCLVEGAWVGGDESDESFVPPPGCAVTVTCVPRRQDDVPR